MSHYPPAILEERANTPICVPHRQGNYKGIAHSFGLREAVTTHRVHDAAYYFSYTPVAFCTFDTWGDTWGEEIEGTGLPVVLIRHVVPLEVEDWGGGACQ